MKTAQMALSLIIPILLGDNCGLVSNILNIMISAAASTLKREQKNKTSSLKNLSIFKYNKQV